MNEKNFRIFVEKKEDFQTEANSLLEDLRNNLNEDITSLRLLNIYDIFNISDNLLNKCISTVFSEVVTDNVYYDIDLSYEIYFACEFLPGQYDQRAHSAMQLISLIDANNDVVVKSGTLIIIEGNVNLDNIKNYYINKIETREKNLNILQQEIHPNPSNTSKIDDFFSKTSQELIDQLSLAMTTEDMDLIKSYFKDKNRLPYITEIKVLDTYWSDHCRHTTFGTNLDVEIKDQDIIHAYHKYLEMKKSLHKQNNPITLMDIATINMKYEFANNNLKDLEVSDEHNACSIYVDVDVDGKIEKWLLMFKNETHNHPTEIEPFGGASTCIGGAIRDPLSGRSFVYQAMRVTGSGDIRTDISQTLEGKLPQKVISKKAAQGYSSYGNQIGLATNHVREIYHQGYIAKRLEVGAVIGANPLSYINRMKPEPDDVIILIGGKTGRDGIGGATGSSKQHDDSSLSQCATEVQKGNALEERKLQRLFRNPQVTTLIKKANDFGAGGVCVAIGELADGLEIYLDKIPTKYSGLSATELAISESQERMAVVISHQDIEEFIRLANEENLEATLVAKVTNTNRLVINYNNQTIVDIDRSFINTNGAKQYAKAIVNEVDFSKYPCKKQDTNKDNILKHLSNLNSCSQKGLIEMFDSTIGANTVLMPYGGVYQDTPTQGSVSKLPVLSGTTTTCSIMTFGYNPYISEFSPFHGAKMAIVESISKLVAIGGDYKKIRFSFQEYFERLTTQEKWGKPLASLLGAAEILHDLSLAAIGGKDSMSGTFKDLNVPPTLISFAVATEKTDNIITPELKEQGNCLYLLDLKYDSNAIDIKDLQSNYTKLHELIKDKQVISAYALEAGGLVDAIIKMSLGNRLGINISTDLDLFNYNYGAIVIESKTKLEYDNFIFLGNVTNKNIMINGIEITHAEAIKSLNQLENIYPVYGKQTKTDLSLSKDNNNKTQNKFNKNNVNVLLPVFPGTNCEYDTARAFEEAGGTPKTIIFKNRRSQDINESINQLQQEIDKTDILVLSGGFSAGDEPEGSGKFIACILNNEVIKTAIQKLLARKGLILGICNGFQALIKSGLLPYGKLTAENPTLVKNEINRHVSKVIKTRVASINSPWLTSFNIGDVHDIPISHGEGKFVVNVSTVQKLFNNGQVAFQYCDYQGNISNDYEHNPNGSDYAIEGIISEDGLILGKMGHSERKGNDTLKNIYGNKNQDIFKNAINYFKEGPNNG